MLFNQTPFTPPPSNVDNLMSQLSKALTPSPIGTHYQGSTVVRPDVPITGGVVSAVRSYIVVVDKIMIPYKDMTGPLVGQDGFLEGQVSESDLIAAGCNISYLLALGHIVENGFASL